VRRYRLLMLLAWLAVPFVAVQRVAKGKDSFQTFRARLGFGFRGGTAANPKLLWLHAASVGEFNTLKILLPALSRELPDYDHLITVSNKIAFEKARALQSGTVHVSIAPLDFTSVLRRFLNRWQPACMITIENEVYPNRNVELHKRRTPIVFVNARMSAQSHARWARNPDLARTVFGCIDYCFAQDENSHRRFADLGVDPERLEMPGNLKQFQTATLGAHPDLARIQSVFPYQYTICAASTHKGEDRILLQAFGLARKQCPQLKLILVPRHARRAAEIEALIKAEGFSHAVRSKSELPAAGDDIYLADTMGEMSLWYTAAAITFVAGSLVPVGGHTPYEPAAFGSAIVHGSQYANFQAVYEGLIAAEGSIQANTPEDIARAWLKLTDPDRRDSQIKIARQALGESTSKEDILRRITRRIASFL